MPQGKFLAWVAEVDSQIVATSGLVFFQRPPYNGNLSGLEAYIMNQYGSVKVKILCQSQFF
ncbi:hypothetical protein [uncultured Nostoc sp.]|uniref:hypothetical protein n=1 Tax=uncultured Nostoc sp. TaxID=340711 RepID=UPI0035CBB5D8